MKIKYPKTPYLSYSPRKKTEGKIFDLSNFAGKKVVATLRYDGDNTTFSKDYAYADALSSFDADWDWFKEWVKDKQLYLNPSIRICGEYLYNAHSIHYKDLDSYFYAFSAWNEISNYCLSWEETSNICYNLQIPTMPCIYQGVFDLNAISSAFRPYRTKHIGYVLRLESSFSYNNFDKSVAKWDDDYIKLDDNWIEHPVKQNILSNEEEIS